MDKTWGLALGGGVARGIAHVGVLKALEEAGLRVGFVSGTSSGSLVAALYAAGVPVTEMEDITTHARWRDLVRLSLPRRGLIALELAEVLAGITPATDFNDLAIPLGVVACDITTGERVVIRQGRLAPALEASCAIPGIFHPVRIGQRLLVDGGLVENIPAQACRELGAQHVLAVSVSGFRPRTKEPTSLVEIMINTVQILASRQEQNESTHADVVLHPPVSEFSPVDLEAAQQLIARGYQCAQAYLEQPEKQLGITSIPRGYTD